MALMPWNEDLALGIASIDAQHRELVDRINALHDQLGDAKALGNLLEDLVDATMNHFIAEEELLKRHGYAQADAHALEHSGQTGKLVQMLDQFQANAAALTPASLTALKDWLTQHIQSEDKACAAFLKSKGEQ
jgi:hemerythrin